MRTKKDNDLFPNCMMPKMIELVDSTALHVSERVAEPQAETATERAANRVLMGRNENQRTPEVEH